MKKDMMQEAVEAEKILRESNTIIAGDHFVYISGHHGDGWVNKDAILPDTRKISRLAFLMAESLKNLKIDIVCGPAVGGLVISQWVAYHMDSPSIFTEHQDKRGADTKEMRPPFELKRGFDKIVRGKNVLIVDDIVNTGLSIRETADAVRKCDGQVIAASAYCTRGNVDAAGLGVPQFIYLVQIDIPAWAAEDCTLCKAGVPVNTDFAHGREFVESLAAVKK